MGTATRFHSLTLLSSSLRQQHWRVLFWVMSAIYLIMAFGFSLGASARDGNPRTLFQALQLAHAGLAFSLPAALASRLVDDKASGTLQFAQLAGFSSAAWIRFRLLVIAAGYTSIWVLRIPFYAFLLYGGGATWEDLLIAEILHTALAIGVAQVGLLAASHAELASKTVLGPLALLFLSFGLMVPTGLLMFVGRVWSLRPPNMVNVIAEALRSVSIFRYILNPPVTVEGRQAALLAALLPVLIGLYASRWLSRRLYADPDAPAASDDGPRTPNVQRRPSREVWSNPFFWQASEYHFADSSQQRNTVLVFAVSLAAGVSVALYRDVASVVLGAWMIAACVTVEMLPAACAGLELKAKTLSSLATLPCGGRAIYLGWKRAGDKYRLAAWLAACGCVAVIAYRHPMQALIWAAVAIGAVWSLPPLAFIETLRVAQRSSRSKAARFALAVLGWPVIAVPIAFLPNGVLILAGTATLSACAYRHRAMRQMDDLFVTASSS